MTRTTDEGVRAARLLEAQDKAAELFAAISDRGLIAGGRRETQVSDAIREDTLPVEFDAGRAYFEANPGISGAELFGYVVGQAQAAGWKFGGPHSGHLVGEFPHEKIDGDAIDSYIAPGSDQPMRRTDRAGHACHWILEIHLVDTAAQIGGFFEELLDLGHSPVPAS
jgi:hypothetical protein